MSKQTVAQQTPATSPLSQGGILQRKCETCGQHTVAGGECEGCKKKRPSLQRRAASQGEPSEVPPIVYEVLQSPGQPLEGDTRDFMESRFGHDFSQVQVHTNVKAAESAQAVNALAYTAGRNVVFGAEQYKPQTIIGKQLLAHELAHVIQQEQQTFQTKLRIDDSSNSEQEANKTAHAIMTQQAVPTLKAASRIQLSRQESGLDAGVTEEIRDAGESLPGGLQSSPEPSSIESLPEQSTDLTMIDTSGSEPVSRVVISCSDRKVAFVTPSGIHLYNLDPDCQVALGSYDARVEVNEIGRRITWTLGEHEGTGFREQARFRYRIQPGQENPATLFRNQRQVRVDSVQNISIPRDDRGQECFLSFPERRIIDFEDFSKELFEPRSFSKNLWEHTIPLGELGWFDAIAYAKGSASGELHGNYGPGMLRNVCLRQRRGTNQIGGRAHFHFPASIGVSIDLRGQAGLLGEWLSFINVAHAAAELNAHGEINGDAVLDANLMVFYDRNRRTWSFEGDNTLTVQGGLGFSTNLILSVSVVGFEVWRQHWNLVNRQIGVMWEGGLSLTSQGIQFRPGRLEIGTSNGTSATSTSVPGRTSSSASGSSSSFPINELVGALLSEARAIVEEHSGGQEQGGICLPPAFLAPGSPPGSVDDELRRKALRKRVAETDLSLDSFRRNYAVFKASINGQTVYPEAFNDEGALHSEALVVRQLETMDPGPPPHRNTRIIQVYTERQPCPGCTIDIEGLRRVISDFPVFYTVARRVPGNLRARRLMQSYCLTPPSNSGGGQQRSEPINVDQEETTP